MSRRAGTWRRRLSPSDSRVAQRMGRAAFFAPLIGMVPKSCLPPRTRIASIGLRYRTAGRGRRIVGDSRPKHLPTGRPADLLSAWLMRCRFLAASILVLGLTPRFVAAAGPRPSLDLRNFHPSADPQAGIYFEPAASPRTVDWSAAAWLSYAYRPVTLRDPADEIAFRVIEH